MEFQRRELKSLSIKMKDVTEPVAFGARLLSGIFKGEKGGRVVGAWRKGDWILKRYR